MASGASLAGCVKLGSSEADVDSRARPAKTTESMQSLPSKSGEARPNILLAIADDQSWGHTSFAGDPVVRTPTFDRIAREGVVFENAYCSAPSCSPSRAALLTGRNFYELGTGATLWGQFPRDLVPYTMLLESAGYHVGAQGKGYGPGDFAETGWLNNPAGQMSDSFDAFLDATPEGQPFCYWYGSREPHRPYPKGSGAAAGKDPAMVRVPAFLPDVPEIRSDILDYYQEVEGFDEQVGRLIATLEKRGLMDNTLVVMTSDNGMPFPRAKANVYDYGVRMPLAIRWPASVAAGRTVTDFVSLADLAPTFLEAAGIAPPPIMTARSLMPVLDSPRSGRIIDARDSVVFGIERHTPIREKGVGYPMRAIRTDRFLYIRNFEPGRWPAGNPPYFADIDASPSKEYVLLNREDPDCAEAFQLACKKRPPEELYDLEADPAQMNNVADQAGYSITKTELRARLDDYLKRTGDPRLTEARPTFDQNPYVGRMKSLEQMEQRRMRQQKPREVR